MLWTGVWTPVGWGLLIAGGTFMVWDTLEGFNAAEQTGRQVGNMILERDREEWEEIDRELNINNRNCPK